MSEGKTSDFSSSLLRAVAHLNLDDYYWRPDLFRERDIFICSYPRSGSHFIRFLLLSAHHYRKSGTFPSDFSSMSDIPDVHRREVHLASTEPRLIKTHFPHDPRYRHIIHLVRDPRDVLLSYYHLMRKAQAPVHFLVPMQYKPTFDEFVNLMLEDAVWPCSLIQHQESFTSVQTSENYLRVRYEDLVRRNRETISRVLHFVGLTLDERVIDDLMEHVAFSNMQRLHHPSTAARGGVFPDQQRMLRRGEIGSHRTEVPTESIRRMEQAFAPVLHALGYEGASSSM
jgi:hypothetical protein